MSLPQIGVFVGVDYLGTSMMRSLLSQWAAKGSATSLGSFESAYGAGQIIGSLVLPHRSDSKGRRSTLQLSCLGTALGYGMSAWAVGSTAGRTEWPLLASRVMTGLTKQTLTMARAIVGDVQAPERRQAGMAILTWASSVGYLIGPLMGGWLADGLGIGVPMFLITLLFLALVVVCGRLPETAPAAAAAARSGEDMAAAPATASWRWLLAPKLLCALLAITLVEVALTGWTSVARPRLTKRILPGGYSSTSVYDTWLSLCVMLGSGLWGRWQGADTCRFMLAGNVAFAAGLAMLLRSTSELVLYLSAALLGVGISAARTLPAALLIGIAPDSSRGAVMGILDLLGSFCRVLAPLLTGNVIDAFGSDDAGLAMLVSLILSSSLLLLDSPWSKGAVPAILVLFVAMALARQ
uniref:Major facilitator superfamily (MFS) profile domain-containing protein n=1 Tax=Alexandrium monilatum TaxID=311494 RepID=A0A7S4QTZ9_9DINO|mmetsp:Transcript_59658/g.177509  ORF Transcript_59658/g.177509 Transcript_59658/m.177509 type:complete len:409 (+) Transcript_59658:75-1301(+)|eukprot:CAMPEP_0175209188 /NCGR_PEP_ID=MMETSP0093-20121207/14004_1 /TAXON_ID=311494 /ORGANISM="Alexandrium monilatum, Strain CCMP3105" /LENGTH=408 /DNA_ID=CAMNT_0016502385 /DNA_START=73 /DNA_END=1299 /DNA_ORIENTATION=-